jgi:threonylcarbamoyladenosine tRNA methylthiotransferase MtaB
VRQVEKLVESGHPEVVLIGVHLGRYGRDMPEEDVALDDLARWLCEIGGLHRLRFSSIEPREVTDGIIDLVARHPRVCRHLHIPLQSGSDSILRAMGRPYSSAFYEALVRRIRQASPLASIGADVMVGFPGETDELAGETKSFLERLPLSYLHVFSYSQRPGTPAAGMPDQVPPEVKKERSRALMRISAEKRQAFAQQNVGEELEVVVEQPLEGDEGYVIGVSDNYLRVRFPGPPEMRGEVVQVRVTSADPHFVNGVLA